jgi:gamma-tubulin complex component 4
MNKKLHGCQIIDLVYKYTISGNEVIKDAFNRILTLNNEILYKQMREWTIYGNLDDKYDEFFICHDATANQEMNYEDKSSEKRDEEVEGFLTNEIEDLFIGSKFSSKHSQFTLNSARLPSYVNLNIAKKIQFTGELLQLFKSRTLNEIYLPSANGNDPNVSQLSQNLSFIKLQNVVESDKCKFSYDFIITLLDN